MKKPKICVPLTGKTREDIYEQLNIIVPQQPDIIELRADFLHSIDNVEYVLSIVDRIAEKTDIPLLFTIRSEREGGEPISLTEESKVTLLTEVCAHEHIQYVDYEVANDEQFISKVKDATDHYGKKLILSYHNFSQTPTNNELIKRFVQMEMYGANIAKIAVMPECEADVFRLLQLTREADTLLSIPIITMSMGELGMYSRLMGWVYGSMLTFGVGVESSAPGQIPIDELRKIINDSASVIMKNSLST